MNATPNPSQRPIPEALIDRCTNLGWALWRVDAEGNFSSEPSNPDAMGQFWHSEHARAAVAQAATAWENQIAPTPVEIAPGSWLLPIPETVRRTRVGYLIAAATTHHDRPLTPEFVEQTHRMLGWMAEDLQRHASDQFTIQGFTNQLSDAYETIHALYSIGRSLGDIAHPSRVLREVIDRLFETTPFSWVVIRISADTRLPTDMQGKILSVNNDSIGNQAYQDAMALFEEACIDTPESTCQILDERHAMPPAIGPQVAVQPIRRDGEILGLLAAGGKSGPDSQISSYETLLFEAAAGYMHSFLNNVLLFHEQHAMFLGTLRAITASIDAKDRYTRGHSERVAMLSALLAEAAGMKQDALERIHIAGLVHDVGKIGVAEAVLTKPGRLTEEEFDKIKQHPEIGFRILRDIPSLRDVLPGVMHHHERWDGNGYPAGLKGDEIPLMARVIALADTFDAMSSNRSYRPAMPRELVLQEIERNAGTQFDAALAKIFVGLDFSGYDQRVLEHHAQESDPQRLPSAA